MKTRQKRANYMRLRELLEYKQINMKSIYNEIDAIVERLVEAGELHHRFRDGHQVNINDNFAEKNVVFRPAKVARFEAELVPPDKG